MTSARQRPPVAPRGSVMGAVRVTSANARCRSGAQARWSGVQSVIGCAGLQTVLPAKGHGGADREGPASARMRIAWERHDQAPKGLRAWIAREPPLSLA